MWKLINTSSIILVVAGAAAMAGCGASKLQIADAHWEKGEYFSASRSYREVYNKMSATKERAEKGKIAFRLGECYRRLGEWAKATVAYKNAIRYGEGDRICFLRLAQSLHATGQYKEAIENYELYVADFPDDEEVKEGLRGARKALDGKDVRTRYNVKNAKNFNSRRSTYAPFYFDGSLYFTSSDEKAIGSARSAVTGMKRSDLYVAGQDEGGRWQQPKPVKGELNTESDEGVISITPDGREMYLTRATKNEDSDSRVVIIKSTRLDGNWSEATEIRLTEQDSVANFAHPSVSPDGYWLYFSSDRSGTGDYDLWRMPLHGEGRAMEHLGPEINTLGNEVFPFAATDSILYFSSDGHAGFGGLDIFKATLNPDGHWNVENMEQPINSPADDFGITFISQNPQEGFFSSNRGDSRGYDHIYRFELPDISITISGEVRDKDEEPIGGAIIRIVGNDGTNQRTKVRDDGSFSLPLNRGVSYTMLAGAEGYLNAGQEFVSDPAEEDADYYISFTLASVDKPNIVENIFYDYDKASLRPESASALDGLVKMLHENPNITIEMGSHTDRKGTDEYNDRLSLKRAESVVNYLIRAGIASDRLSAKGYGKKEPKRVTPRLAREFPQFPVGTELTKEFIEGLEEEDAAVADQINRRTEFMITSLDYGLF